MLLSIYNIWGEKLADLQLIWKYIINPTGFLFSVIDICSKYVKAFQNVLSTNSEQNEGL